jgi:hypothetical protein
MNSDEIIATSGLMGPAGAVLTGASGYAVGDDPLRWFVSQGAKLQRIHRELDDAD